MANDERDFVNHEADITVALFALTAKEFAEHKARGCGCGQCRQSLLDAQDRILWATSDGP